MSGALSVENYAVILIWIGICSVYTTLLTVTALGVICILRKRRSSILKSQRPPRTPFSELEFNVATPTDTAKSRRVSFSRRTGVAEFVTNEATTTWKNFYEEHNKSLESSGNESGANAPRPPVGHIGKRIFDQQFEEVEAVDFMSTLDNHSSRNINISMNNVNFTQQLASLECTADGKLPMPMQNFEMSAFTDHQSKLFTDDLAVSNIGEASGRIDINFSAIQTLAEVKDDLDEIQKDLERAQNNVVCPGPFTGRKSLSEYIEVDLNATHVTIKNDDDDMSITDTIHSPKVQEISKNSSQIDKKSISNIDWVADKENIALNPYATPKESTNFAINDESDKILVFDGKRLTVQSDKEADIILKNSKESLKPIEPVESKPHQRKTIVLNVNDDLPNFVDDPMSTSVKLVGSTSFKHSVMYDIDDDISITQPVVTNVNAMPDNNVTVVKDHDFGDISLTQAVNNVILPAKPEKRRTIVFDNDNCDISVTQALPANILGTVPDKFAPERRRTILYENDMGDISMTQAIPANIILNEKSNANVDKSKTLMFDNIEADISMTQVVPANLILAAHVDGNDANTARPAETEKRKTIVFESDNCDISMTQALPSKIIAKAVNKEQIGRRRTILYDDNMGDISVTQAIPTNIILNKQSEVVNNDNKTIIHQDLEMDLSMTQAVPANLLIPANNTEKEVEPTEEGKRKTIVFENDDCDISITRALPTNIVIPIGNSQEIETRHSIRIENDTANVSPSKDVSDNIIVINNEAMDKSCKNVVDVNIKTANSVLETTISPTKLVTSIIPNVEENNRTIAPEASMGNISITGNIPTNIIVTKETVEEKRKTIVFEDGNISITRALPANIMSSDKTEICENRKTIVYESKTADNNISVTQAVLVNVVIVNNAVEKRSSVMSESDMRETLQEKRNDFKEATDTESASFVSEDQHAIMPVLAEAILPEKDETAKDDDVIRINNDLPEDMSFTECAPTPDKKNDLVEGSDHEQITSSDSLIYIVRDTEGETQTDNEEKINKSLKWKDDLQKTQESPPSIEYDEEIDKEVTVDLPKKIIELKSAVHEDKSPTKNRHYEKIRSAGLEEKELDRDVSRASKSFRDANDTNELLEMLSDLTDKGHSDETEKPAERLQANEPRRLSVAPNRLSIVISREDLLNNISMAQAALQRSIETDESMEDTTTETPVEVSMPPKKATRVSNEVVKKLHFEEDESTSETSLKSDRKGSLLKKTAFGETSYMKEVTKGKVIPSYLKDVSDDIKALMNDLVKPNADNIPFNSDKCLKKEPSTCSTQIQANLITSSQIDLDTELTSATESTYDIDKVSMPSSLERSHSLRSSLKSDVEKHRESPAVSFQPMRYSTSPPAQERVIVFDHNNPLNNICLAPIDFTEVHRYDPPKSTDTICTDSESLGKDLGETTLTTQFVANVAVTRTMQAGDSALDKSDAQSMLSKRTSMDESVSARVCELKDTKVNTVIAMKANKDLLEASSSLTLVDDTLAKSNFDVDLDMVTAQSSSTNAKPNSPVKLIYHNEEQNGQSQKTDSEFESAESYLSKGKKRNYSPAQKDKHSALSAVDVTPKPTSKMQKLSTSPNAYEQLETDSVPMSVSPKSHEAPQKLAAEKEDSFRSKSSAEVESSIDGSRIRKRSPRKSKSARSKKPGTNVTVQQLITQYDVNGIDQDALNKQIIKALSGSESSTAPNTVSLTDVQNSEGKSPDLVSSFTSSKNQNEMREACSGTTTEDGSRTTSSRSRSVKEWQPEVSDTNSNVVQECDSSVNVVAKIDMLPFMGSHECEWESWGVDTWSFRLLRARLRLSVRLEHRHDNATRSRVRADTPVRAVALDAVHKDDLVSDKKNSVATLCVRFAAESMRYYLAQGCARAGDVPGLLRRCAGVARVALRWGRAMHEARMHLAYTLTSDGCLSLKVANLPLRSVWEVSLRLALEVGGLGGAPWPRAGALRVSRVVSEVRVREAELRRVLAPVPEDWGHAPRTIWKIFKYLKNKTREDDLLGA